MAETKYIYGLGRRKAASARARLYAGKGEDTVHKLRHGRRGL